MSLAGRSATVDIVAAVEKHLHILRVGPEPDDCLYAMEALLEAWEAAFDPLSVLQNQAGDPHLRCRVADTLGASCDTQAVHPLLETLRDENIHVRWSAIEALKQIGSPDAIPELGRLASSDRGRFSVGRYTRIRLKVSAAKAIRSIEAGENPYNFCKGKVEE